MTTRAPAPPASREPVLASGGGVDEATGPSESRAARNREPTPAKHSGPGVGMVGRSVDGDDDRSPLALLQPGAAR